MRHVFLLSSYIDDTSIIQRPPPVRRHRWSAYRHAPARVSRCWPHPWRHRRHRRRHPPGCGSRQSSKWCSDRHALPVFEVKKPPQKNAKKEFQKMATTCHNTRKKHMFWEAKSSWPHKNGIKANCPATNLAGWGTRAHFVQVGWDDHFIDRVEMENCLVQPKTTNQINASCFQERWSTQKWQQTCLGLRKPPSKSRF